MREDRRFGRSVQRSMPVCGVTSGPSPEPEISCVELLSMGIVLFVEVVAERTMCPAPENVVVALCVRCARWSGP